LPREVKQKLAKVARLAVSCMCSSLFWECLFLLQTCEDLCKIRVWY
jgi:hypothetical protein